MPAAPKPNSISISDIKSRVLNVAQTSIYTVKLGQPPGLSNFGEFEGVSSNDISNLELSCAETSLPGSALATHDVTNDCPDEGNSSSYVGVAIVGKGIIQRSV